MYYDQRENRLKVRNFTKNKKVLDVFSYAGSFAVNAAYAGAKEIYAIDQSECALAQLQQNFQLNSLSLEPAILCGDAFEHLKELNQKKHKFDVIFLDPPAFIKRKRMQKKV